MRTCSREANRSECLRVEMKAAHHLRLRHLRKRCAEQHNTNVDGRTEHVEEKFSERISDCIIVERIHLLILCEQAQDISEAVEATAQLSSICRSRVANILPKNVRSVVRIRFVIGSEQQELHAIATR